MIFGIIGSVLGNSVATWIGVNDTKGVDWTRHLLQLAGAVLIVWLGDMAWVALRRDKQRV